MPQEIFIPSPFGDPKIEPWEMLKILREVFSNPKKIIKDINAGKFHKDINKKLHVCKIEISTEDFPEEILNNTSEYIFRYEADMSMITSTKLRYEDYKLSISFRVYRDFIFISSIRVYSTIFPYPDSDLFTDWDVLLARVPCVNIDKYYDSNMKYITTHPHDDVLLLDTHGIFKRL